MSDPSIPGVVFDCNVFAQALINPRGPAGNCVRLSQEAKVKLYVSEFIVQEIWELPSKLPQRLGITINKIEAFLQNLGRHTFPVPAVADTFTFERDVDDAEYVNLALTVSARYLVSRDNDLLSLMNQSTAVGADFLARFPGLPIVDPVMFLQELKGLGIF